MPRKQKALPAEHRQVAGYIRKSKVIYPDTCATDDDRRRYVEDLRRIRMAELVADAERDGETITTWYDDMDISGRSQFIVKRVALAHLNKDAKEGKLRLLYARDLSRLYRAMKHQEFWFDDMAEYGCEVRCADLPRNADPSMTKFQRQIMGSLHEFNAERNRDLISATLMEKVEQGQWVGRCRSVWGLKYNTSTKAYDYDPETAPNIIDLFEECVRQGGIAHRVVNALNERIMKGTENALYPQEGGATWHTGRVLVMVRSPLYRRCTSIRGIEFERPAQIPEVVPPELVESALRLVNARGGYYQSPAKRVPFTYSGILRCGYCGHVMRSGSCEGPAGAIYTCSRARQSRVLCPESFGISSPRVDAMIGEALHVVLQHERIAPEDKSRKVDAKRKAAELSTAKQIEKLDHEMQRLFQVFRGGKTPFYTYERYEADMVELQEKRAILEQDWCPADTQPARQSMSATDRVLIAHVVDEVWAAKTAPSDPKKSQVLRAIGLTATVTVHGVVAVVRKRTGETARRAGKATMTVAVPSLGYDEANPILVEEDDTTYEQWRRGSPQFKSGDVGRSMRKNDLLL